ncbi:phage integrase central domain-containing protein [Lysobacter enzymogenes]|uniref:phage integrase central domain-containing protein n=1 Tax=Lysobacter enzymogenes TaxID=69 RepID=UPI003D18AC8D
MSSRRPRPGHPSHGLLAACSGDCRVEGRPIAEIAPPEVLMVLRGIESGVRKETTRRVNQKIGQVFRYAIATGRAERDPTVDLRGALTPPEPKPRHGTRGGWLRRPYGGLSGSRLASPDMDRDFRSGVDYAAR